ncbi:hypothetical protein Droror1_Dr00008033, partial [Drosera rotundifolia]
NHNKDYVQMQMVANKEMHRDGVQRIENFVDEVRMLSNFRGVNLVKLIGYCAKKVEQLLVYESTPPGTLEDYLH